MIIDVIKKLVKKENLTPDEMKGAMSDILNKEATPAQVASFLTALRMKGETIDEIVYAVRSLKEKAVVLDLGTTDTIDIVGTGGDGANTFNISTATAFVVASGGVKVAKHGNRAASSKSGSADVLESLGANISLDCKQNNEVFNNTGICFMFAPLYNPSIKNVLSIRSEIKIRTIFNMLGPLINPSKAKMQLIGVYDKNLVEPVAYVMKNLGVESGIVLFGECGLDEGSIVSKTYYAEIKKGIVLKGEFSPEDFGLKRAEIEEIKGGEPIENAEIMRGIFEGSIKGAKKDVVALNSGLAFYVAGVSSNIKEGVKLAQNLIENGNALKKLNQFIESTKKYEHIG